MNIPKLVESFFTKCISKLNFDHPITWSTDKVIAYVEALKENLDKRWNTLVEGEWIKRPTINRRTVKVGDILIGGDGREWKVIGFRGGEHSIIVCDNNFDSCKASINEYIKEVKPEWMKFKLYPKDAKGRDIEVGMTVYYKTITNSSWKNNLAPIIIFIPYTVESILGEYNGSIKLECQQYFDDHIIETSVFSSDMLYVEPEYNDLIFKSYENLEPSEYMLLVARRDVDETNIDSVTLTNMKYTHLFNLMQDYYENLLSGYINDGLAKAFYN